MRADQMAEDYPVVPLDAEAIEAARLMAQSRSPGIVVVDADGSPRSILPAAQVVSFLVPIYVQDDPSLAGVLTELAVDKVVDKLKGKSVRSLMPRQPAELPRVASDDTIIEVAAVMARLCCPLVVVMDGTSMVGVITASRLLELALAPD